MSRRGSGRSRVAILVADAVGYSSLMEADEEGTLGKYKSDISNVVRPLIADCNGRLVKKTGDGFIAIFPDSPQAFDFACRLQGLGGEAGPAGRLRPKLTYRIGINAGDVIVDDDDVYGNDVNVAARLESLAEPGGMALSGVAYWDVKGRTPVAFQELGFLRLKNFTEPIQVYKSTRQSRRAAESADAPIDKPVPATSARRARLQRIWTESRRHQPEVIVLPFENLSNDREQDLFCDGMTNDLTTDLSRFANLLVIAATTAFTYRGRRVTPVDLRRDLGVEYVVGGSVQRAKGELRINVQLVDTATGRSLWGDRYTVDADDVFAVRDDICRKIVMALVYKMSAAKTALAVRKETESVDAYDAFLRGQHLVTRFLEGAETAETLIDARRWLARASQLDANYGRPLGWTAYTLILDWQHGWSDETVLSKAEQLARKAVAVDPDDHDTHWALASVHSNMGQFQKALTEYQRALEINANDADLHAEMADLLSYLGKHREAIGQINFAKRINPQFPEWYRLGLGWCYYFIREWREAVTELESSASPSDEALLLLAMCHMRLSRAAEDAHAQASRRAMESFRLRRPDWTLAKQMATTKLDREEDIGELRLGLQMVGLAS